MAKIGESYLVGILDEAGPFSRQALDHLKDGLKRITDAEQSIRYFTNHGAPHAERTLRTLARLVQSRFIERPLNAAEAFAVLATAWVNSVGFGTEHAGDAGLPPAGDRQRMIRRHRSELGLGTSRVADIVGALVLASSPGSDIAAFFPRDKTRVLGQVVRLRFLAALLSLASVLDCSVERGKEWGSPYVRSLPEDVAWHWRAARSIRAVRFDQRAKKIIVSGSVRTAAGLELFNRELAHLQAELERALPYLITEGLVLLTVEGRQDDLEVIDARDFDVKSVSAEQDKLETYFDLKTTYRVNVIRRADCEVARTVEFVNSGLKPIGSRRHFFYSDSSFFLGHEDPVKAWSGDRKLRVRMVRTAPARIEFDILFPRPVNPGKSFTYTYEIFWPDCFPAEDEFFTGNDFGLSVRYELVVPSAFEILSLVCVEIRADGQQVTIARLPSPKPSQTNHRKEFALEVRKSQRSSNTSLFWKWARPP